MKKLIPISLVLISVAFLFACKKFVQLDPPDDRLNYSTAYATNASATAVLNGLYIRIMESANVISTYSTTYLAPSADETRTYFANATSIYSVLYKNELLPTTPDFLWNSTYALVYHCNVAIEGIEASNTLSQTIKQQLLGEAKFMRALCYYYLVNTYGRVPLLITSDYRINGIAPRAAISDVYAQMVSDLNDAKSRLSKDFLNGDAAKPYPVASAERVRPTFWAASALLARIYLYDKKWANAEKEATMVLENTNMFSLAPAAQVFLKNSRESIFQLQTVSALNYSLLEARIFVLGNAIGTASFPMALSPQLSQAFEPNDQRRTNWVGSVSIGGTPYLFPYKYRANNATLAASKPEYLTILRLAEQYLIRAEARSQQNNTAGALSDLNTIRARAGLPASAATTSSEVLNAIFKERQLELFCEQGHRWFDLKRTGRIDEVMSAVAPAKGGTWSTFKQLFPVPINEINTNRNLDQNPGYN